MLRLHEPRDGGNIRIRGSHLGVQIHRSAHTRNHHVASGVLAEIIQTIESRFEGRRSAPMPAVADIITGNYTIRRLEKVDPEKYFIYAIKSLEFVKIGLSNNVNYRLESLRLGNPHELTVVRIRDVPKIFARKTELKIHEVLREFSVGREWFKISPERACEIIDAVVTDTVPDWIWPKPGEKFRRVISTVLNVV